MTERNRTDQYRALFEQSADAILIIDGDRFVDCNQATVDMLRHRDKQELFRCRVELPDRRLDLGETLDLTKLPGWRPPVNGNLGNPFHLRVDTEQWSRGCRLRATARFVARDEQTSRAIQKLTDLIRSKEVLPVEFRSR